MNEFEARMISVNDDLPCNHQDMIDVYGHTADVFVLVDGKEPGVAFMAAQVRDDLEWYWSGVKGEVTHWMPVPKVSSEAV